VGQRRKERKGPGWIYATWPRRRKKKTLGRGRGEGAKKGKQKVREGGEFFSSEEMARAK
jgi:hypothetical protein